MIQRNIFFMMAMLCLIHIHAQVSENQVGFNHEVRSHHLGKNLQVQVYLPEGYDQSTKNYPTLYLLDGQRFFLYGVSLLETYQQYELTPEFIVVGISTNYPHRFGFFSHQRDSFHSFLKSEVIKLVEENYRVADERILFGWEYGGSLAFHILNSDTQLFNGYLLASPFPVFEEVDQLAGTQFQHTHLTFSVSPDEFSVNHGVNKLDSLLSNTEQEGLQWNHLRLSEEVHRSTPYSTLYHGIKQYFQYYSELQIDNFDKFLEEGALTYAYDYNLKRSEQYGYPQELSAWTKFTIMRSAMRADEFQYFKQFSEELKLDEFFQELSDSRINDLATYFEENQAHEMAVKFYKYLLIKHPESINLLNKTGNSLQAMGRSDEAKVHLEKASALSEN